MSALLSASRNVLRALGKEKIGTYWYFYENRNATDIYLKHFSSGTSEASGGIFVYINYLYFLASSIVLFVLSYNDL